MGIIDRIASFQDQCGNSVEVSIEKSDGLYRRLKIVIPGTEVEERITKNLDEVIARDYKSEVRPYRHQRREVLRRYKSSIEQHTIRTIADEFLPEAIEKQNLDVVGRGRTDEVNRKKSGLTIFATLELYPEIQTDDLKDIEIVRLHSEITDQDVDDVIENLRDQNTVFAEPDKGAAGGHQVDIDFAGYVDGSDDPVLKASGSKVTIGDGGLFPGLEDALIGMKKGDEKDITLSFPADYLIEELAGNDCHFHLTMNSILEITRPELNDDFFQQFDVVEGGLAEFRLAVRSNIQRELDAALESKTKENVLRQLEKDLELEVPKGVLKAEIAKLSQDDDENLNEAELQALAESNVKRSMILRAIRKVINTEVNESEIQEIIRSIANSYEDEEKVIEHYNSDPTVLKEVKDIALEKRAIQYVLESAKVVDKKIDYVEATS